MAGVLEPDDDTLPCSQTWQSAERLVTTERADDVFAKFNR